MINKAIDIRKDLARTDPEAHKEDLAGHFKLQGEIFGEPSDHASSLVALGCAIDPLNWEIASDRTGKGMFSKALLDALSNAPSEEVDE